MNQSKEKARKRCLDLIRKIKMFERNGKSGHKVWHRAQNALGCSLAEYRQLGATSGEIIKLGLTIDNEPCSVTDKNVTQYTIETGIDEQDV